MPTVMEVARRKSALAIRAQAQRRSLVLAHLKRQATRRANHADKQRAPVVTGWFQGCRAVALCVQSAGPYAREVEVSVSMPMSWEEMPVPALQDAMMQAASGAMSVAGITDTERVRAVVRAAFEARGL